MMAMPPSPSLAQPEAADPQAAPSLPLTTQVHVHVGQSSTDPPTLVAGGITAGSDSPSDTVAHAHTSVKYATYGCTPSTVVATKSDPDQAQIHLDIRLSSVCLLQHLSLEVSLADSRPGSPTAAPSPRLNSSGSADTVPATPVAQQEFPLLTGTPASPRDLIAPATLSSSPPALPLASGANENEDELSDSLAEMPPTSTITLRSSSPARFSPTRSTSSLTSPAPAPAPTLSPTAASTSPSIPSGSGIAGRRRAGSMSGNRSPKASPPRLLISTPTSPPPASATLPPTSQTPSLSPLAKSNHPPDTPPDSSPTTATIHHLSPTHSPPSPAAPAPVPPTISLTGTLTATESGDPCPLHFHLDPSPAPPTPALLSRRSLTYTVLGKADHLHLKLLATSTSPTSPPPTLTILSLHLSGYPLTTSPDARHLLNLLNLSTALSTCGNTPAAVECKTLGAIASLRAHKVRQYADLMRAASLAHVPLPGVPEGKQRGVFRAHVGATLAALAADANDQDTLARVAASELAVAATLWVADEEAHGGDECGAGIGDAAPVDKNALVPETPDLAWVVAHRLPALLQLAGALLASGIEYHMTAGLDLITVVLERAALASEMQGRLQAWLMLATQAHHDLCLKVTAGGVGGMSGGIADLMVRARQVLDTIMDVVNRLEYRVVKEEVVEGWVVACADAGGWNAETQVFLHQVAYTVFAQHPTLVTNLPASYFESVLCSLFPDVLG